MGMRYDNMKKLVIVKTKVHDGYNGKQTEVGLSFYDGKAFFVAESGYYGANGHTYSDQQDMLHHFAYNGESHFPSVVEELVL